MAYTVPAHSPAIFGISPLGKLRNSATLASNYRLTSSLKGDEHLYSSRNFKGDCEESDELGIIKAVRELALLRDSGVISIRVTSHSIEVVMSMPSLVENGAELLRKAVRRAGHPIS